ncbi:hypothetical protein FBALC1_09502 [Flavobacteriales bacterium ALC-1]|nr:hypothetical protein FBALC1_09502 [Flavobacteriales bacterium ALC-1]
MQTRLLISILFLISTTIAFGQDISKQVIGSTGTLLTNGTNTINFTVGESVVGLVQSNATINQGFWASTTNEETLSVTKPSTLTNGITYYPNPVINDLTINFKADISGEFNIVLYDISGREVYGKTLNSTLKKHKINMSSLSNGAYVMYITSSKIKYNKSIKIIKI